MSILVVDDEPLVTRLVTRLLRTFYFDEIETAHDGATALEMLRESRYELVISDYRMEPVTGLELLASIRANSQLRETCFLMMAGGTETELVSAAYSAGMDAFILKPFSASMLRSKLREICESKRLLLS
ncbi:response regulator [Microvirga massiliensis]|uniref:response regulator n=1 Tax=Microvirga massiliensis TaxID=1033741 RepID=UPI00062B4BD4|nr:response regulator [Microvirga massiliensis]